MNVLQLFAVGASIWVLLVAVGWFVVIPWLRRGPDDSLATGLLWRIVRIYTRIWHRVHYTGAVDEIPTGRDHGGLIVVANHTGALDPVLIQAECRFLIRWMMARETMNPELSRLWQDKYVLGVDRDGRDSGPLREAIRHVRAGGTLGIFPEGRITMPPGEIRPFLPGVGFLIAKAKAPVLLAWVSGTPETNLLGEAFAQRSTARVHIVGMYDFEDEKDPDVIAAKLREEIQRVSGWPLNDAVIPPGGE